MRFIFLIGPRACGKTTVGRELARVLGCRLVDTDALLHERSGATVADIVAIEGWEGFRRRETAVLRALVAEGPGDAEATGTSGICVVSTGGGIVLAEENRRILRASGQCFYLHVPVEELVRRLSSSPLASQRPSLTGRSVAEEAGDVAREREPVYRETAHHVINAGRCVDAVVRDIRRLARA